jgi:hypothetical protein
MSRLGAPATNRVAKSASARHASGAHDWHSVGHFFTTLTIGGLTCLLAVLTVALLAGGYATVRRLTV